MADKEPIPLRPGVSAAQAIATASEPVIKSVEAVLADAANDAQRAIVRLAGRGGLGSEVRRAQLAAVRVALRRTQRDLWALVGKEVRSGGAVAAETAVRVQGQLEAALYRAAGGSLPDGLLKAELTYANSTVDAYWGRMVTDIPLSEQVYRSRALSSGWVDRAVNRVLLQGGSWRDLAKAVRPMIDPETPGGVSYAAKRLARTELNNAFHAAQVAVSDESPYTTGMQWHLSRSHPKADVCDEYAQRSEDGGPPGFYQKGNTPRRPHPQCYCYVTPVQIDEDEFLNGLLSGKFDDPGRHYRAALPAAG